MKEKQKEIDALQIPKGPTESGIKPLIGEVSKDLDSLKIKKGPTESGAKPL
jgi:hypothetical protein